MEKIESPSILKWEQYLSKTKIKSKDSILESIQQEQNYLNIIYLKIIKQIKAFEENEKLNEKIENLEKSISDLKSSEKENKNKLQKYDEALKSLNELKRENIKLSKERMIK